MDIVQIGLKIDSYWERIISASDLSYGRGLEQASGLGYWFIAATFLFTGGYGFQHETIAINDALWAWMAALLGTCQLYYGGLAQRKVFNLMATTGWVTIAISAFAEVGGWNLLTAIALPYCLCSFYIYGFLIGEEVK
jgi:hypothetical protein